MWSDQFNPGLCTITITPSCYSTPSSVKAKIVFLWRWRIFYFQLSCMTLATMSPVSEAATQKSFLDRSLQLLQLPPWNFLFPQRRTFVPQIAKSPRKISSHPNKNLNRQFDGYFYWRKHPPESFPSSLKSGKTSFFLFSWLLTDQTDPLRSHHNIQHWRVVKPLSFGPKPNFISLKAEKMPGYSTFTLAEHIRWDRECWDVC